MSCLVLSYVLANTPMESNGHCSKDMSCKQGIRDEIFLQKCGFQELNLVISVFRPDLMILFDFWGGVVVGRACSAWQTYNINLFLFRSSSK